MNKYKTYMHVGQPISEDKQIHELITIFNDKNHFKGENINESKNA